VPSIRNGNPTSTNSGPERGGALAVAVEFDPAKLAEVLPSGGITFVQGCSGQSALLLDAVKRAGDALGAMTFIGIFVPGRSGRRFSGGTLAAYPEPDRPYQPADAEYARPPQHTVPGDHELRRGGHAAVGDAAVSARSGLTDDR
jgi:hypothetical protein